MRGVRRAELIERIARRTELPPASVALALEATLAEIEAALARGEPVALPGFGRFEVARRAARAAADPRTGERIAIDEMAVPRFRAGTGLRRAARASG
jgi:DNA-binding protein HU-beta